MKTDDLIMALAADSRPPGDLRRSLALALAAGAIVAGAVFFATIGFRSDIDSAARTLRFLFKFVLTLSLAAAAIGVAWRIGRPGMDLPVWTLAVPPVLLAGAVGLELLAMPDTLWMPRLIGTNALHCVTTIPLLSIPTLAALLYALRGGAPSSPALAGAVAGLAASGIAATYYASNCTDDSPLFVAIWYTIAVLLVTAAGALLGRSLLRW
ncbi:MAG: DUF1109 family protein [Rhizobium sp.]|nr:DUF1109 family protein [Rhizobium sp.]